MAALTITGARVLGRDGGFQDAPTVYIRDGRFAAHPAEAAETIEARGRWLLPGVRDVHTHISWSDFHADDRRRRTPEEQEERTRNALIRTLRAGVTSIRDAGGAVTALRAAVDSREVVGPAIQTSVTAIGRTEGGPDAVRARVVEALAAGAQWVKLIATAGVAASADAGLESHFTEAEFAAAAEEARRGGARVMVHSWGGDSLDFAIEQGVASIEHGIFLTQEQAERAVSAGITFVPTLAIYQEVRRGVARGALPGIPLERLDAAIAQHALAVRYAQDAGLPIALGSDFGAAEQHGRNLIEIAALQRAGISAAQALIAATVNGSRLLGEEDAVIAPGAPADAVLLSADPEIPTTFDTPASVDLVIQHGEVVFAPTAHREDER